MMLDWMRWEVATFVETQATSVGVDEFVFLTEAAIAVKMWCMHLYVCHSCSWAHPSSAKILLCAMSLKGGSSDWLFFGCRADVMGGSFFTYSWSFFAYR